MQQLGMNAEVKMGATVQTECKSLDVRECWLALNEGLGMIQLG